MMNLGHNWVCSILPHILGKINTKKRKILIIGDSFTEGVNVNNDEVYYNYLDTNKYEIFAYGCGGYGTLQEFMIIDEYFDEIKEIKVRIRNLIDPDRPLGHNDTIKKI